MNRDWHSTPIQGGGRNAYDYGRIELEELDQPMTARDKRILVALVVGSGTFMAGLLYWLWLALNAL